eukprot:TRINITY_DN7783_c0_g2_i4.p1 TRINITY_DN7783_c0_g2~~TRINITY_DN7783_c0_g2_i4.p1  ORF type:complete len:2135 (-),score=453.89 TRINITY_DN7783_c0_g2_i4:112-6516(-)
MEGDDDGMAEIRAAMDDLLGMDDDLSARSTPRSPRSPRSPGRKKNLFAAKFGRSNNAAFKKSKWRMAATGNTSRTPPDSPLSPLRAPTSPGRRFGRRSKPNTPVRKKEALGAPLRAEEAPVPIYNDAKESPNKASGGELRIDPDEFLRELNEPTDTLDSYRKQPDEGGFMYGACGRCECVAFVGHSSSRPCEGCGHGREFHKALNYDLSVPGTPKSPHSQSDPTRIPGESPDGSFSGAFVRGILKDHELADLQDIHAARGSSGGEQNRLLGIWTDELRGSMAPLEAPIAVPRGDGRLHQEGQLLIDEAPDPYGMEPREDVVSAFETRIRKWFIPTVLDCGSRHTAVLTTAGDLYVWGDNTRGQLGIGMPGETPDDHDILKEPPPKFSPTAVRCKELGGYRCLSVACGAEFTCVVTDTNSLFTWGDNYYGQLGHGDSVTRGKPAQVMHLTKNQGFNDIVVQVACGGAHSVVLTDKGSLLVMGLGAYGALGKGDVAPCDYPKPIDINMSDMSAPVTPLSTPRTPRTPRGSEVKGREATKVPMASIACGTNHTLALSQEGKMFAWGLSTHGRLGIGESNERLRAQGLGFPEHILRPRQIRTLFDTETKSEHMIQSITAGDAHSAAVTTEGQLFVWGAGENYRLGISKNGRPSLDDAWTPALVEGPLAARVVTTVACGAFHTLAATKAVGLTKAALFVWGGGYRGKLGTGLEESPLEDLNVSEHTQVKMFAGKPPVAICGSALHSVATTDDGNVYSWGFGGPMSIAGHNSAHTTPTPKQIVSLDGMSVGIATHVTPTYRTLEASEEVGDIRGATARTAVSFENSIEAVECGGCFGLAVTTDGDLYAWGDNSYGQLGMPKRVGRHHAEWRPNQIPVGFQELNEYTGLPMSLQQCKVLQVSAGYRFALALAQSVDGTKSVFAWGCTDRGCLGIDKDELEIRDEVVEYGEEEDSDGIQDFVDRPTPVELGDIKPAFISAGAEHAGLLTEEGLLFTWGNGHHGRLGHNDTEDQWTPKQVMAWKDESEHFQKLVSCGTNHTLSVSKGDKVFSWGSGWRYKLGHGAQKNYLTPREISALRRERVCQIIASEFHSSCLTEDGEIYTWGYGANGRLGHGKNDDTPPGYSPEHEPRLLQCREIMMLPIVQHTDLLTQKHKDYVVQIASGSSFMLALTWSGAVFAWGQNDKGQLGLNTAYSQPGKKKREAFKDAPTPLRLHSGNRAYIQLSCGASHTVALEAYIELEGRHFVEPPSNSGHVFSWGNGGNGRLGHGRTAFGQGGLQDRPKEIEVLQPHSESPCAQLGGLLRGRMKDLSLRVGRHYKKLDDEMLLLGTDLTLQVFQMMLQSESDGFEEQVLNLVEMVDDLEFKVKKTVFNNLDLQTRVRMLERRIKLLVNNKKRLQTVTRGLFTDAQVTYKRNLAHYEVLLFLLQREPRYLSRLCLLTDDVDERRTLVRLCQQLFRGSVDGDELEHVHLLRLMQVAIKDEFLMATTHRAPLQRGSSVTADLIHMFLQRSESVSCQKKILRPLVDLLLEGDKTGRGLVDLDLDPLKVYKTRLLDEKSTRQHNRRTLAADNKRKMAELKAKRKSEAYAAGRRLDTLDDDDDMSGEEEDTDDEDDPLVTLTDNQLYQRALKDETTTRELRARAEQLISAVQKALEQFSKSVDSIPFGVRFLCKQVWQGALLIEEPENARHYAASLLVHDFFIRGLAAPDAVGVTPDELIIPPKVKLNLLVMCKVLHCLAIDEKFSTQKKEDFVEPVNLFLTKARPQFNRFMEQVVQIESLESYTRGPLLTQYTTANPPQIKTRFNVLFGLHRMVAQHISILAESMDDPLQIVADDLDNPAPELVEICQNDFCVVLLVDRFGQLPKPPPKPDAYDRWFRDTKQVLMRSFQQMMPIESLKKKHSMSDGSNNIDKILKIAKVEASATQHYSLAKDINELQVRLSAMRESGKVTLEQLQLDVMTDIRNFSFNQVRLDQEAALLFHAHEVALNRRRFLMLQEKAFKTALVQAREMLFKPAEIEPTAGWCETVSAAMFLTARKTDDYWYPFHQLVEMGLIEYETSSLPERFLRECRVRFFSDVPGVVDFTVCSGEGTLMFRQKWFFDDLLLSLENFQQYLDLKDELQLNVPVLLDLLNSIFCVDIDRSK